MIVNADVNNFIMHYTNTLLNILSFRDVSEAFFIRSGNKNMSHFLFLAIDSEAAIHYGTLLTFDCRQKGGTIRSKNDTAVNWFIDVLLV